MHSSAQHRHQISLLFRLFLATSHLCLIPFASESLSLSLSHSLFLVVVSYHPVYPWPLPAPVSAHYTLLIIISNILEFRFPCLAVGAYGGPHTQTHMFKIYRQPALAIINTALTILLHHLIPSISKRYYISHQLILHTHLLKSPPCPQRAARHAHIELHFPFVSISPRI